MSRFNHSKTNMQKRVACESRFYDRPPFSFSDAWNDMDFNKRPERWLKIYFGRHKGKTLPQIVLEDPGYVVTFLYYKDIFFSALAENPSAYQKKIAHQLEVVANRMNNIKAPAGREFAIIVDREGVFGRFVVLKKGRFPKKPLRKGSKIDQRLSRLNIGIPLYYQDHKLGFERLGRCLRRFFLGSASAKLSAKASKDILNNDDNSDLTKVRFSKWLKPSSKDYRMLKRKYLNSLAA